MAAAAEAAATAAVAVVVATAAVAVTVTVAAGMARREGVAWLCRLFLRGSVAANIDIYLVSEKCYFFLQL
jgi:hypothetical protein